MVLAANFRAGSTFNENEASTSSNMWRTLRDAAGGTHRSDDDAAMSTRGGRSAGSGR